MWRQEKITNKEGVLNGKGNIIYVSLGAVREDRLSPLKYEYLWNQKGPSLYTQNGHTYCFWGGNEFKRWFPGIQIWQQLTRFHSVFQIHVMINWLANRLGRILMAEFSTEQLKRVTTCKLYVLWRGRWILPELLKIITIWFSSGSMCNVLRMIQNPSILGCFQDFPQHHGRPHCQPF